MQRKLVVNFSTSNALTTDRCSTWKETYAAAYMETEQSKHFTGRSESQYPVLSLGFLNRALQ